MDRKDGSNGILGIHCQEQLRCENPSLKGFASQLCTLHDSLFIVVLFAAL